MQSRRAQTREKPHRLQRDLYRGETTIAFTACVAGKQPLFIDREIVRAFIDLLRHATDKHRCRVLIYCFMPDHLHLVLQGQDPSADPSRAMIDFKQQSGFWLGRHRPTVRWQKDFYDHIVRAGEDLAAQLRYVANNPVRKELVEDWRLYPFTGAIGVDLCVILEDVGSLLARL